MTLRVATLNVWALPRPLGHRVPERLHNLGVALSAQQLDLVAFQEVWTDEARDILVDAGFAAGLIHAWHRPQALGGSGLLVLSRWPFLETEFEGYLLTGMPHLTQLDYYGGKGFARIRVEGPEGPFTLFNTHLQARYGRRVDHEYVGHRAGQIIQLARAMRDVEDPVLLLGDFNMREDHAGYAVLRGLTAARDLSRDFGRAEATVLPENPYRDHDKPRRVDYVFARDGRRAHWEPRAAWRAFDGDFTLDGEPAAFSDHAGVMAELDLREGEGWFRASLDPEAVGLAESALRAGRARARDRLELHRGTAALALGGAAALATVLRTPELGRRRFLRSSLQLAVLGLAAPAAGFAVVSELAVPDEVRAFDLLRGELDRLGPIPRVPESADPARP